MIDVHCHFDMMPNPEECIRQWELAGNIVIGMSNLPSHFQMGLPYVRSFKHIRLALGMHPLLAAEGKNELTLFRQLVSQTSFVGEIGLDFSREGFPTKDVQVIVLRDILDALKGKKKIVSVHSRRAEKELLTLLREYEIQNVIFHWYCGPMALISDIVEQGYYFSVNEAMTLSKNGQAIIEKIPKERILTESDVPYNEKADIMKTLSRLRITEDEVHANFKRLVSEIR